MSYHETYEFFAIDRRLTPAEVRALSLVSTRATITPTRFYNFYDWGGLKADPRDLVRRYFDLFVYTEWNSGARWGMLRFPAGKIDRRVWRTYVAERPGATAGRCASTLLRRTPPDCGRAATTARARKRLPAVGRDRLALKELSVDRATESAFAARLDALLEQHRTKQGFRNRVVSAGLVSPTRRSRSYSA